MLALARAHQRLDPARAHPEPIGGAGRGGHVEHRQPGRRVVQIERQLVVGTQLGVEIGEPGHVERRQLGDSSDPDTNTLPSGIQYYVKVCDVPSIPTVNWPARSIDHKLGNKEFDEEDFFVSPSTQLAFSQQPVNKKYNTAFPVKVSVLDAFNQLVANDNATQVTLALNAKAGGGTLSAPAARPPPWPAGRPASAAGRAHERRRGQELPAQGDELARAHIDHEQLLRHHEVGGVESGPGGLSQFSRVNSRPHPADTEI